jgi:hypothetical protein
LVPNDQRQKSSKDEMKKLHQPTGKQPREADSIRDIPLLDGVLIKDFRHDFIVVDLEVVEDDDIAQ